jgi:hypothetical protein
VALLAAPATPMLGSRHEPRTARQDVWAPPGTPPLSDARAAALITPRPENRSANAAANAYVPTKSQLRAFYAARDAYGRPAASDVPERRFVTGRPRLRSPATDDLIQWVAHKWGIPEDWIRAQMAVESWWHQPDAGDPALVPTSWYARYPPSARIPGSTAVYESMGISQVKWRPDGSDDPGSEPLRWQSTAFALDLYAAKVRFFYNGDCQWCGNGYRAGQSWASIGGWYEPYPWRNAGQEGYIAKVQRALAQRPWEHTGF